MLLNIPAIVIMVAIACITGLTVFAHYAVKECDPLASGQVETPNQVRDQLIRGNTQFWENYLI